MARCKITPSQLARPLYANAGRAIPFLAGRPLPSAAWVASLGLGIVGLGFLGLMIFSILGLVGLLAGVSTAQTAWRSTPILLVMPSIGAATADAEALLPPASELTGFVDSPVVQATPLPAEVTGEAVLQATAPTLVTYRELFQEVGAAYEIDWRLLAAVAFHESSLVPSAVGRDGDMGLMQILPGTWDEFAPPVAATDPFDPRSNVEVGASYLLYLQDYLGQLGHGEIYWVLAAYNWGPDNVRKLVAREGSWEQVPERTRRYVADILHSAFGIRFVD